ncbi:MAG: hypothetical protein IJ728_05420 [Selenomonadaceae bacterium]|nr:hypothetical protein [Selenomonadaceae bacterium]
MLEIKVFIEASALVDAINNLANALSKKNELSSPAFTDEIDAKKGLENSKTEQPSEPTTPTPSVPLAQPPQYTVEQIMQAGATLMDAGKVNDLIALLQSFGIQAVKDLKPEQLGAFATELRKLGAKI